MKPVFIKYLPLSSQSKQNSHVIHQCFPGVTACMPASLSHDQQQTASSSDMVKLTKAKTFQAYLDSCHRRYSCVHCRAHLANHDDLISKVSQLPLFLLLIIIITTPRPHGMHVVYKVAKLEKLDRHKANERLHKTCCKV